MPAMRSTIDWPALWRRRALRADVRIVANLPYGVATRLLIGWLETEPWPPWFTRMTLMFQKEVAERIVAAPGTKAYGRLSVISQWRSEARIAHDAEARRIHAAAEGRIAPSSSSCRAARWSRCAMSARSAA